DFGRNILSQASANRANNVAAAFAKLADLAGDDLLGCERGPGARTVARCARGVAAWRTCGCTRAGSVCGTGEGRIGVRLGQEERDQDDEHTAARQPPRPARAFRLRTDFFHGATTLNSTDTAGRGFV